MTCAWTFSPSFMRIALLSQNLSSLESRLRPLRLTIRSHSSLYKPKSFSLSVPLLPVMYGTDGHETRRFGTKSWLDSTSRGTHLWETASRGASVRPRFSFSIARRVLRRCSRTCQTVPPCYRTWITDTELGGHEKKPRGFGQKGIPISVSDVRTDFGGERGGYCLSRERRNIRTVHISQERYFSVYANVAELY